MSRAQVEFETPVLLGEVLSTLKDYIYAFDQDGRFLYANQTLLDLWGLSEAEALGKTMADLAYPKEVERKLLEGVKAVFDTGQTVTSETFYTSPSGTSAYYENIFSPVFAEDGRVAFVAGTSRDISKRKRTEAALREREGRLAIATEATDLGVFEWQIPEDTAIWENERLYDIFGLTPGEPTVSQREFFETYLHPDDAESFGLKLEEGLKSGLLRHATARIRRRDGTTRTIELSGKFDFAEDGSPVCLVGVVADITERVEQEERLRRNHETFYNLIQNTPFGIYIVDANFRLSQISSGSQKVFSNVRPLLNRDFAEVLRVVWPEPFASEAIGRFRHTLETGEPYHAPNTTERRGDIEETESYDWKIERIVLPDGRYGVVCYFYDFTELQKVEAALHEANEQLQRLNEQQKRFVADAAHELRAPLTSIQGNLQMLSQYQAIDPATQQEMLGDVRGETERLGRLVTDLLAIARGDSGLTLEKTSLALEQVLLDGWRVAESLTTQHTLELTDLPRAEVTGNADRLKQLAIILLENAINYTPEGGRVTLGLSQEAEGVLFYVRDTGVGISKEDLPHVFERFYRADQGRRKEQRIAGSGLGLAIAQLIVQQHEGKIWLESEPGKGTTVWVQLPSNRHAFANRQPHP